MALPGICSSHSDATAGRIVGIAWPIVVAAIDCGAMHECVLVGHSQLLGEIISLKGETASIQVFDVLAGLSVGEPVVRTGAPLSIELGPGLLASMFDGIQRPLADPHGQGFAVSNGANFNALDRARKWPFAPLKQVGDVLSAGDVYATVCETSLMPQHRLMLPPLAASCIITAIAAPGLYTNQDVVLRTECGGTITEHTMVQIWPIRTPRPVGASLPLARPLLTGERALDAFFTCCQGGTTAITSMHGCLKPMFPQIFAANANADVIVYVGCGERGMEMADMIAALPALRTPGARQEVFPRIVMVASPAAQVVSAREASIYTGVTIAEYYRDMGYNTALMVESLTCWGEAVRAITGLVGSPPGDQGHAADLVSRVAAFFSRAGRVECHGTPGREGSLTILAMMSQDVADPLETAVLGNVQGLWAQDGDLARRKQFPPINWLTSFSRNLRALDPWLEGVCPDYPAMRDAAMAVLRREAELGEVVRAVGKVQNLLPEADKVVLDTAKALRDDFLAQNNFLLPERQSPMSKTTGMLRNIMALHTHLLEAVKRRGGKPITLATLRAGLESLLYDVACAKFKDPVEEGEAAVAAHLQALHDRIARAVDDIVLAAKA